MTDGTDVLYNKFNVTSSSPPDNPPQHPNSDYNCVVATTGRQWRVSRCDEQRRVVCRSDYDTLPIAGIMTTCLHQVHHFAFTSVACLVVPFSYGTSCVLHFTDVLIGGQGFEPP